MYVNCQAAWQDPKRLLSNENMHAQLKLHNYMYLLAGSFRILFQQWFTYSSMEEWLTPG